MIVDSWHRRFAALTNMQFARFVVVGLINTALNYAVYCVFLRVGFALPAASLASLVIGILINFTTQSRFVFNNRKLWKLLPYFVVWAALYLFNLGLIWSLMRFGANAYSAGLISTPFTVLLSFFLQNAFVFRVGR